MSHFSNKLPWSCNLATSLPLPREIKPTPALDFVCFLLPSLECALKAETRCWTPGRRRVVIAPLRRPSSLGHRLSSKTSTYLPVQAGAVPTPLFVPFLLATFTALCIQPPNAIVSEHELDPLKNSPRTPLYLTPACLPLRWTPKPSPNSPPPLSLPCHRTELHREDLNPARNLQTASLFPVSSLRFPCLS
jgi:hypothetical protein